MGRQCLRRFLHNNPWIMVNPNYTKINAKDQVNREDPYSNIIRN